MSCAFCDIVHGLLKAYVVYEDEATLGRLAGLGCDLAQGYHFSKPLAPVAFKGSGDGPITGTGVITTGLTTGHAFTLHLTGSASALSLRDRSPVPGRR